MGVLYTHAQAVTMAGKRRSGLEGPSQGPQGSGGKVANDHNKVGRQKPQQKNQGQRTPFSRSDRDALLGSDNQSRARQGGQGAPSGGKSR